VAFICEDRELGDFREWGADILAGDPILVNKRGDRRRGTNLEGRLKL